MRTETLMMLKKYVSTNDFGLADKMFPSTDAISHVFMRIRNRLTKKLCEPKLKKDRLYDLRHYFATMFYHRTKDILLVKEKLGHKKLETTLIYTHLINFSDDEFVVRMASNVDEATILIEIGFEYVTEMDGVKIFKKRK
ncbi:MAG: tyrosine-type recombinase/integrase [Candidatus Bathyarchaeota archaeon]|nr:MAG: tyrosine-type recombinase/integrase [Candidatus Bathyarchaeota archaeon]